MSPGQRPRRARRSCARRTGASMSVTPSRALTSLPKLTSMPSARSSVSSQPLARPILVSVRSRAKLAARARVAGLSTLCAAPSTSRPRRLSWPSTWRSSTAHRASPPCQPIRSATRCSGLTEMAPSFVATAPMRRSNLHRSPALSTSTATVLRTCRSWGRSSWPIRPFAQSSARVCCRRPSPLPGSLQDDERRTSAMGPFGTTCTSRRGSNSCRSAGCVVTDLTGGPLDTGRGLIVAADAETHASLVQLIRPHLEEVLGN